MANRVRFWQTEELEKFNLFDITPRKIKSSDIVDVLCRSCKSIGRTVFKNLRISMISRGVSWQCEKCAKKTKSENGKKLVGSNNPFFNKRHTEESRKRMQISSRKRWDNDENKVSATIKARKCAYAKYGGNPMSDPDIKLKHKQSIEAFWKSDKSKEVIEKIRKTNLEKYGATSFVHSDEYVKDNQYKSAAENEIMALFSEYNAHKRRKDGVELDIYIPELRLAIEYNGAYWHSEIFRPIDYHVKKTEYCELQGIKLIQIFDHEWAVRKQQITDFLVSKKGNLPKVGARKCSISIISDKEAQTFADKYHIQGGSRGSILCLGLIYNGELVSVCIFGKHHRQYKKIVLKRFVSKNNILVVGGLAKLSKAASEILKSDIITWADRRITDGASYKKAGWEPEEILPPDYFYIKHGKYYCSKQARRKSVVNTPANMTEREHAKIDGLHRVYDCGKIRFIYKKN